MGARNGKQENQATHRQATAHRRSSAGADCAARRAAPVAQALGGEGGTRSVRCGGRCAGSVSEATKVMVARTLLVLAIYKRTGKAYYAQHDAHLEKQKAKYGRLYGRDFATLPASQQRHLVDVAWWWPAWEYNDNIGFLEIGLDGSGNRMIGDVWLKRRHLERRDAARLVGWQRKVDDILFAFDIPAIEFEHDTNVAWAAACDE